MEKLLIREGVLPSLKRKPQQAFPFHANTELISNQSPCQVHAQQISHTPKNSWQTHVSLHVTVTQGRLYHSVARWCNTVTPRHINAVLHQFSRHVAPRCSPGLARLKKGQCSRAYRQELADRVTLVCFASLCLGNTGKYLRKSKKGDYSGVVMSGERNKTTCVEGSWA